MISHSIRYGNLCVSIFRQTCINHFICVSVHIIHYNNNTMVTLIKKYSRCNIKYIIYVYNLYRIVTGAL